MSINKAEQQSARKLTAASEDVKIEILKSIKDSSNTILAPVQIIKQAITTCVNKFSKNNELINRNINRLDSILRSLNGLKEQVRKLESNTSNKNLEKVLRNTVSTIGSRRTTASLEHKGLGQLADTVKLIAKQQKDQTTSAEKNTQQLIKGAEAQTKAVLLNQDKVTKAKEREKALGKNDQKPVLPPSQSKKEKMQRPVLPFSMKEFLGGLGRILSGILNPVAIITSLVAKFLPYVLLAVAFFSGVWTALSTEVKRKVIEIRDKVIKYAAIAFALFKGPVLVMNTLNTIYHTARMFYLTGKWAKDMVLWMFQMKGEVKKQRAESSFLLFRKAKELIRHTAEMASIFFKNHLALLQFIFSCAAWLVIIGAVALVVVGIIYLFSKFGDQIVKAVSTIIEVFRGIGSLIVDACIGFFKIVFSPVIALIEGIAKAIAFAFMGGRTKTEQEKVKEKQVTVKMDNSYAQLINKVTEPLNSIKDAVVALRDFFVGSPMEAGRRYQIPEAVAVPESTRISNIKSSNTVTIRSNDSISERVNTNYIKSNESDYDKSIKQIIDGLNTLNTNFEKFLKNYKPARGGGYGRADGY